MKRLILSSLITVLLMAGAVAGCTPTTAPPTIPKVPVVAPPPVTPPAVPGGPGYATGPLNMIIPPTSLILDNLGAVKTAPNQLEISGRQYEATGSFPLTINGAPFNATSLKVISSLKLVAGIGEHVGTIDVDIDTIPGGHLALEYKGTANMTGSTIYSKGTFKTTKTTGIFAGLVADGTYQMTIIETAATLGAPATVSVSTVSTVPATTVVPPAVPGGPGYATGPLNMIIPPTSLILDNLGAVKTAPNQLEISGRQYEATGSFPLTINGAPFNATSLKVISSLKLVAGIGEHVGTIDVDIDTIPGGHLALEYKGTANMTGSTIYSKGTFKTTKTTGIFAGLVADGTYQMTIIETAATLGAPATVSVSTVSTVPATTVVPPAVPGGPGYATGPLNMIIPPTSLILDNLGAVKTAPNQLEISGRQYEATGSFPLTINGAPFNATSLKVISSLKLVAGIGEHIGTIDVDIDTIPGGHLALEYKGTANMTGSTIYSKGTFKTTKTTGIFAGLVADGTYQMTIIETAATLGAPATVSVSTMSP